MAGIEEENLLPVEQAFVFNPYFESEKLNLYWQIAPGYYLYQDQLKIINHDNHSLLDTYKLPQGLRVDDPTLGQNVLYRDQLLISLPRQKKIIVIYQGCAQNGFCYAPQHKLLSIENNNIKIENTQLNHFATQTNILWFLAMGILLTFSPCVLPMIPLIINLIIGAEIKSKFKSFILASTYVLGMACSYTTLGILTGILGATFQAWLQQPTIVFILAFLLIILGLMQIDIIKFSVPHANKLLHNWSSKQRAGSLLGAFILGILSAFIVSPCITPPLIGALTYLSQGGSTLIAGLSLLLLALGMGVPLVIVAMLSRAILPTAGRWMHGIKIIAGISLIALAIWIIQPLIPALETTSNLPWQKISSIKELETRLAAAKSEQQYTLVEVYASWCSSCRKIEATIFSDPQIKEKLKQINLLKIDITDLSSQEQELLNYLQVYGPPTILFFNPNEQEIKAKRIIGNTDKDAILSAIPQEE